MIPLGQFVQQSLGACIDLDGAYGCQCVDLADAWALNVGRPLPLVNVAADFIGGAPGWQWIANDPDNHPEPGDLVVWNYRIGPAGHIDLCVGPADASSFQGLDQNWFDSNGVTGSPGAVVTHNYYGVAGWMRPLPNTGGGATLPATPFYVNTHQDARWFDHPDQHDMGPAGGLTNLKIVEVANDGASDWYRWEGGSWWIVNTACDVVAPPAAPPPPPSTPLEARITHVEAQLAAIRAALNS